MSERWVSDCGRVTLHLGDCLDVLKAMPDNSVDSIVSDPPAGIAFMCKDWDKDKGGRNEWISWMESIAAECLRVIKPGGHALVWSIPRTSHWTGTAWENAGWSPRDQIAHIFGSGFPKSHDVSKAIDKMHGAEREIVGSKLGSPGYSLTDGKGGLYGGGFGADGTGEGECRITAPATSAALQWNGWGTALKPAMEIWWLLRKPLDGTVAANVLEWGTGGINVDGCRVESETLKPRKGGFNESPIYGNSKGCMYNPASGRWPANLIHDGSDEVLAGFPETKSGFKQGGEYPRGDYNVNIAQGMTVDSDVCYADSGSAARFFYVAKASRADRNEGCEGMPERLPHDPCGDGRAWDIAGSLSKERANHHPTVKPTALMRYLCRLITPPGGIVLDPFMGSGSTGKGAVLEGFQFVGIDREADYLGIAKARILHSLGTQSELLDFAGKAEAVG